MNLRFPWATHIAPLAAIAWFSGYLWTNWSRLPAQVPGQYGWKNLPNYYMPTAMAAAIQLGTLAMIEGMNLLASKSWARVEGRKRLNWLTIFFGGFVPAMMMLFRATFVAALSTPPRLSSISAFGGGAVAFIIGAAVTAFAETRRKHIPREALGSEEVVLPEHLELPYRQTQTFAWPIILATACLIGVVVGVIEAEPRLLDYLIPLPMPALLGLLFLALSVWKWEIDDQAITLKFKFFPWYTAKWMIGDIESAEAVEFSPLADFFGWGFKFGVTRRFRGVQTCNMRGSTGVLILLKSGVGKRGFMLGMDNANYAAALVSRLIRES